MDHYEGLISFALKFIGVHEVGVNRGPEVEMFQKAIGGKAQGQSWCADYVCYCIKEYCKSVNIIPSIHMSESCLEIWNKTDPRYRSMTPKVGYITIWQFKNGNSGHCGIVCVVGENVFSSAEGNTSAPSKEVIREGDIVAVKVRSITGSRDMKIIGFIDPFGVTQ